MQLSAVLPLPKTRYTRARAILLLAGVCLLAGAPAAQAAVEAPAQSSIQQDSAQQGSIDRGSAQKATSKESTETTGNSLESAAQKADSTGRTIAMSLIGLALAIASIVLAFRRDFKEAAGVFVVGIVAVLLATPAGLKLLEGTVTSLFG
ncbi:MAG: hypothetical protein ACLQQB_09245 [Solirubrobacteraceae bacterium]|jgi:opacity protein-like surface antigen